MRLYEITGDIEDEVYDKLKFIYFILSAYSTIDNVTDEVNELLKTHLGKLNEDPSNLIYWVLSSERISNIYSEIKKLL